MKELSGASLVALSLLRFEDLQTDSALKKLSDLGIKISRTRAINILNTLANHGLATRESAGLKGRGRCKVLRSVISSEGRDYIENHLNSPIAPSTISLSDRVKASDFEHDADLMAAKVSELEITLAKQINECITNQSTLAGSLLILEQIKEQELKSLEQACIVVRTGLGKRLIK